MSEEVVVDTCVEVSALLADKGLSNNEVCKVLERLAATVCMEHDQPRVAAMALTWNIQKFVEVSLRRREP